MLEYNPLVSIVIPTFNTASFIIETLESVLNQTWTNREIILVDDGSTDETAQLLQPYQDRILYIYQENRGLGGARNTGIRNAQGDLFAFLDADDLWHPEFLERQVHGLLERPSVDVLYSWWSFIDEHGNDLPEDGHYAGTGNLFPEMVLSNRFPVMSAILRWECIEAVGGFDENRLISEDWDFWLRLAQSGAKFDVQPQVMVKYRFHGNNMTLNVSRSHLRYIAVLDKLFAQQPLPEEILRLKAHAYSQVYLTTSVTCFLQGNEADGQQAFLEAVRIWPELLGQEETYYRLICADQPPGYRATQMYKNLALASKRITRLLEAVYSDPTMERQAADLKVQARAVQALAQAKHYYLEGQNRKTRGLILEAMRSSPRMVLNREIAGLWIRALLGRDQVQQLKQRARRPAIG